MCKLLVSFPGPTKLMPLKVKAGLDCIMVTVAKVLHQRITSVMPELPMAIFSASDQCRDKDQFCQTETKTKTSFY